MKKSQPKKRGRRRKVVLTSFNTTSLPDPSFQAYLADLGSSPVTVRTYAKLAADWMGRLETDEFTTPAACWLRWEAPPQIKRLTGYACRAYARFSQEVLGQEIDLGIPRRLPPPSRPRPHAPSDAVVRRLRLAAKTTLPRETGYTVRVWISLVDELGLRRSEADIGWHQVDFDNAAVTVFGKTGPRALPLSAGLVRVLRWLHARRPDAPWSGARGQRLDAATLYEIFKDVARSVGAGHLRPHLLRHRRLTAICKSDLGKDQLRVLRFAGQRHLGSLQYYYDLSADDLRGFVSLREAKAA